MSAPTPAPGDENPREGYYPDPSIPGYVRYWNGASWVPGTSRPAPQQGGVAPESPPPPSGGGSPSRPGPAPVEETGPMFFDELEDANPADGPGERQEPSAVWQADTSRQTGFGGDRDHRVSWGEAGRAEGADPRGADPRGADPRGAVAQDPTAGALPGMRSAGSDVPDEPVRAQPSALSTPLTPGAGGGSASWAQQAHQLARPEQTARPQQQQQQQPQQQPHRPSPQQPAYQQRRPVPAQQQGGRPDRPVPPWKPPVEDPFQRLARAQASARPAGLGKRFAARLLDTVVLGALVGAACLPLATRATDHIDAKIEAAKQSGETVTVWLVDSTTAGLFGAALGVFLVLGFVLEALPTAKWGRTLGKKLCGLDVRDIESHGPPTLGAALRRWLVYGVLGVLVVGVVNVMWCLVDRPWRQCWHDKAAHTFVAG